MRTARRVGYAKCTSRSSMAPCSQTNHNGHNSDEHENEPTCAKRTVVVGVTDRWERGGVGHHDRRKQEAAAHEAMYSRHEDSGQELTMMTAAADAKRTRNTKRDWQRSGKDETNKACGQESQSHAPR